MSFNDVTFNKRRVASCQCRSHAVALLYGLKVCHILNSHWKTIGLQMRDPRTTTTSTRRLEDGDGRLGFLCQRSLKPQTKERSDSESTL